MDIDIVLEDADERQTVDVKLDKDRREKAPLYMDGESVRGSVTIRPKDGKRLEHTGIKVQFIGLIGSLVQPSRNAPPAQSITNIITSRDVLRQRESLRVSFLRPRVGGARRAAASPDLPLQLQER